MFFEKIDSDIDKVNMIHANFIQSSITTLVSPLLNPADKPVIKHKPKRRSASVQLPDVPKQLSWLKREEYYRGLEFWKDRLAGFSSPTSMAVINQFHDESADSEKRRKVCQLSRETTEKLEAFAAKKQVTMNSLIQAAWSILLYNYSGETNLLFGTTVSGSPACQDGIEPVVDFFINTLPIKAEITPDMTVERLIKALQQEQDENDEYNFVPLPEVLKVSEVENGNPLFDSVVVFENDLLGEVMDPGEIDTKLTLRVELADVMMIDLEYQSDQFSEEAIDRILGHYESVLTEFSTGENNRVRAINLLTPIEKGQFSTEWSQNEYYNPIEEETHELFELAI